VEPFQVKSTRACVVHDAGNGHVHRIRQVVTFEDRMEPFESQIEARALQLPSATRQAMRLKTLHVAADEVHPHRPYAVDLRTNTLVAKQKVGSWRSSATPAPRFRGGGSNLACISRRRFGLQ
jgi:hypothetical protein